MSRSVPLRSICLSLVVLHCVRVREKCHGVHLSGHNHVWLIIFRMKHKVTGSFSSEMQHMISVSVFFLSPTLKLYLSTVKSALFIAMFKKRPRQEPYYLLPGSLWGRFVNTLGSLMITCPWTCQGIQFLTMLFWERGAIGGETKGMSNKRQANAALSHLHPTGMWQSQTVAPEVACILHRFKQASEYGASICSVVSPGLWYVKIS